MTPPNNTPSQGHHRPALSTRAAHELPTVSVQGLVKAFGRTRALDVRRARVAGRHLDGLDLTVEAGEVHAFLGPNGSGKTTIIRVLPGLLRAEAGQVRLLGGDPWHDRVELHCHPAHVPGDVSLWPNLSSGEVIDLLGHLRGGVDHARRDELLDRDAYSKGTGRRWRWRRRSPRTSSLDAR